MGNQNPRTYSDFCIVGSAEKLSDIERLTLSKGADFSRLLEKYSGSEVESRLRQVIAATRREHVEEVSDYYKQYLSNPKCLFDLPRGVITPKMSPVHGLPDGEVLDIAFHSAFVSKNQQYETIRTTIPENDTVHVRYWKHSTGERVTIVAVHGVQMGDARSNSLAFLPGFFYQLGFDMALFELPFHGRRLTPEFREVGHSLFPSENLLLTTEAIFQSVSDLRQLRLILRALGMKRVGAMGISLGAYLSSLWACHDQLDFLIPMVPMVRLSEVILIAAEGGVFEEDTAGKLRDVLDLHSPLHFTPKLSSERTLVVAAEKDGIVPSSQPTKLSDHFGSCELVWFRSDHNMEGERGGVLEVLQNFLMKIAP